MRLVIPLILWVWLTGCINTGHSLEDPPVSKGSAEPSLVNTENGLILSWMEPYEGDILLQMSVHNGIKWTSARTIAKGQDWFVNWADFPAIVANGNVLFVHFLQKSESDTFSYDIMYAISTDFGINWSKPLKLHQDNVLAEHGFVSAIAYKDGFYVSWLDGRNTVEDKPMSIWAAYVDNKGNLNNAIEIDNSTCDCCQTSMALMNNEPVSFYRNRTEDEIRDIYYSILSGDNWREPQSLNSDDWNIAGCPVNGPRAESYGNTTAVTWFSGAKDEEKVKLKIWSGEVGEFGEEIVVDGPNSLGRVDIQMDSAKIYVTYLTKLENRTFLKLSVFDHHGNLLDSEMLVSLKPDRGTGFPRTAIWHEQLIITWTDIDEMKVKVLKYPLNRENLSVGARLHGSKKPL